MPLYSDGNFYYSGGSSQLYSPYYPTTPYSIPTSSGSYSPYSSTYNRTIGGTYLVPLVTPPRSPSYSTSHITSRYQPKLTTITESSPLSSTRHGHGLIPLTRIQSPKYTSTYTTPSTSSSSSSSSSSVGSKYIPPRPILINTADIDVSSSRYRKRRETDTHEELKRKGSVKSTSSQSPSPSGSIKKRGSLEKPKDTAGNIENTVERRPGRSTIRRNRPIVRLSILRSRSKDRPGDGSSIDPNEYEFHDLPHTYIPEPVQPENLGWRQRLASDLDSIPAYPIRKSPGDLIRERYLIQEAKPVELPKRDYSKLNAVAQPIEEVVVALDAQHHTVRRLSLPKCPTFHDICEDISSDKIDDDLNAGELRRRASLIQDQEQQLLNQLQKSASGTFQLIHLERRGSQDSQADEGLTIGGIAASGGQRKSRKSKKVRHKITAFVDVQNPTEMPVLIEKDEDVATPASKEVKPKPKFTFNVDSVDEHDEVHKIFKLPKKKSVRRPSKKIKVSSSEKEKSKLPKTYVSTAEIFTFSQQSIEASQQEDILPEIPIEKLDKQNLEHIVSEKSSKIDVSPVAEVKPGNAILSSVQQQENFESSKPLKATLSSLDTPKPVNAKLSTVQQQEKKLKTPSPPKEPKVVKKPKELTVEPTTLKTSASLELINKNKDATKIRTSQSLQAEINIIPADEKKPEETTETSSSPSLFQSTLSLDIGYNSTPKEINKEIGKEQSLTIEPSIATPKPIRKGIQKSDSGEDFWSQIDTRETIYMAKRKKSLHEIQWKHVEDEEVPSPVTPEIEAKSTIQTKEEKVPKKTTPKKKISPKSKIPNETTKVPSSISTTTTTTITTATTATTHKDAAIQKTVSPKETPEKLTPTVEKMTETSTTIKTTIATTSPKINAGQKAKSPEHQTKPTTTTTTTKATTTSTALPTIIDHNQTPINNAISSEASAAQVDVAAAATSPITAIATKIGAKSSTTAAESTTTTTTAQVTTIPTQTKAIITPEGVATVEKRLQPEASTTIKKMTEGSKAEEKSTVDPKSTTDSTEKAKLPLGGKPKVTTAKTTATTSPKSTQESSSTPINADHFIMVAPPPTKTPTATAATSTASAVSPSAAALLKANTATSPKLNKAKKNTSPVKTSGGGGGGSGEQKTKASVVATSDKTPPKSTTATTGTATTTTTASVETPTIAAKIAIEHGENQESSSSNLAKFATVSNLARCLQDVDADLEEYISSSAELSEDDNNLSDISSPDGCENLTASMKKKLKLKKKKERKAEKAIFDPQKKVKIDVTNKCYVKEEKPRFPLVATPRPLWRREKVEYPDEDTDSESGSDSDTGSTESGTAEDSEECTTSEEYEDDLGTSASASGTPNTSKDNVSIIRMSTCSNDSGFEGGTAPSSPKKMLECDVNCHKKCERLTANLCGVNQKLIVEALAHVKRGAREARDSPSTPPSSNPAYKIDANVEEEDDDTSYTYSEFQKSGRFTAPATVIPKFKNYCVDDFHFLAVLGKGSFGKVLLAELRDTTYYYAVKCLKKDVVLEDDDVDSTLIERKVLALGTKHPYLCHLFCTFQTESHLFFVMEYLNGGDLMFHIQESGRFTEERARFYGAEIISGLKFLHKKGIIYRDLKLDNVLLDYEGHVRIADFGMCKLQIYLDKTADSFCGTPDYMAPEIIKGEKYNQNVDWWSFGVLLYEMLIGQSPFSGCDEDELFWSICNEIPWFPVYISSEALSILKGLLEKDYAKRIGTHYSPAGDVMVHKFFRPIDWGLLEKRELKPPFRPQVKHPLDTQYFDRVFTKERVRLTPIDKDILQSMDQKQFLGFTYTNPHIALD